MTIVWDDRLKRNILEIGAALNPRWGRALAAGVDLFEGIFLDTDTDSRAHRNRGCVKKWFQRFRKDPKGIHIIIGKQRAGKTALCFFLAQATQREPIYAITVASEVIPGVEVIDKMAQYDPETKEVKLLIPRGSVCVVDDAQLFFNSMRTKGDDYMVMRNLSNVIEKSDICLVFNAHSTALLNKTPTEATKSLIFKELGFFGAEAERGYVKPFAEIAHAVFQRINPVPKRIKYMVLFDMPYNCVGIAKTPLPKGWNEKVSTSCRIIDAEFTELSKKEDKIKEEEDKNPDERFEDFKQ
jgi:hypothetical protein